MRRILAVLLMVAIVVGGAYYVMAQWSVAPAEAGYRLAKIDRGEIIATVNATGTINPTTTVIVGSQLSGQVVEVLADYNSKVEAGQVIARLNSDQIRAKLDAARADLAQMEANKKVQEAQIERVRADTDKAHAAKADVEAQIDRAQALAADADRAFERQRELKDKGFAAQASHDTARAQRDAQRAAVASVRAQLLSARAQIVGLAADLRVAQANLAAVAAQIAQKQATVRQIEVDLRNSEIRSPVAGVVVQRNVELGQTVAASLQAPTLFLIAEDLRRMEIAASIDETDVGRVKPGQRVTFTVNAYPGRNFEGNVKLVRLGSQTVQNVVIYTTIIAVSNPRLELLPGMTANLRVETDRRNAVLRVPNAALRWRPPIAASEQPVARSPGGPGGLGASPRGPGGPGGPGGPRAGGAGNNLRDMIAALKSDVKLSAGQTKDVDEAVGDLRKSLMGLGEMDPAERRARFRAARDELVTRISAVLNSEQRSTFDGIRERFAEDAARGGQPARIFLVGDDGEPKGVSIRIGASDGGMTEVISGAVEAGRDAIIGGGPRTGGARPPGGRRFGL